MLAAVEEGAFADVALRQELGATGLRGGAAARATALACGTVRLLRRVDRTIQPFCSRPLAELDAPLRAVLRVGCFELLWTRQVTRQAAVSDLVDIARDRGHAGLAGFANGVLRKLSDRTDELREAPAELRWEQNPRGYLADWLSYPPWLIDRWLEAGFETARQRCEAGNREPVVALRVNRLRTDRRTMLDRLAGASIKATASELSPWGIRLPSGGAVARLPGYHDGWFTVQDEAAMLVAPLAAPTAGDRVLDLCAAPGGKTTQLAETMGDLGVILACDRSAARLHTVELTATRLGLRSISLRPGDARELVGRVEPAEVVLVDAPCLGTGTLARRVDLRWRLSAERLAEVVALQRELLSAAVQLVRPGGRLIYATCSLEPEENAAQMTWLAETHPEFQPDGQVDDPPPGWSTEQAQVQLEPAAAGHDGMFVARRRRVV